ncbi:MAG: hypothetical protein EOP83_32635, partial [Verrucomicrobiaceae bacterium]
MFADRAWTNMDALLVTLHLSGRDYLTFKEADAIASEHGFFDNITRRNTDGGMYDNRFNPGRIRLDVTNAGEDAPIKITNGRISLTQHALHRLSTIMGLDLYSGTAREEEPEPEVFALDGDKQMGFKLTIELAPRALICREIIQNAQEAPPPPSGDPLVVHFTQYKHGPDFANKLCIINNAQGMSRDEMKRLIKFNVSSKKIGVDDNRGEGAKIALAKYNPRGVQWLSRKNGITHTVEIAYDEVADQWGVTKFEGVS